MGSRTTPALGRGLVAIVESYRPAPTETAATASGPPVISIEPAPWQPRRTLDPANLADLAASIGTHGVLQPIVVRPHPTEPERYQIIAGERRWRAAQQAGLSRMPAVVRPMSDSEAIAAALVENLQRLDLNAIEEAEGYRRLIEEFQITQEALAELVGKSRSHVANTLRLLHLPASVRHEVERGSLTAGHARALLAHPEPEKALLTVIAQGLNVRQTEALASNRGQEGVATRVGSSLRDPDRVAVEAELTALLGLRVRIDGARSGAVHLHYQTLEQLDGVIELLRRG